MASEVVDGLTLPIRLAGHPALDFCNTRAGWGEAEPKEYLTSYAHLLLWCRESGLLPASALPRLHASARADRDAAADIVASARALRDATYAVVVGRPGDGDWYVVARQAEAARCAARLVPDTGRSSVRTASWAPSTNRLDAPLLAIATAVGDYVSAEPYVPVGVCDGQGCGWVFADPHGRRRWCSMALCGNRAKVRRHADRQRTA